jgi:hypothetical protein
MEAIYNTLSVDLATPSDLVEKLIEFLSREATVLNHQDLDDEWECSNCGKS